MSEKKLSLGVRGAVLLLMAMFAIFIGTDLFAGMALAQDGDGFTTDFRLEDCRFTPWGGNPFFNLTPGYQLLLEGEEVVDGGETELIRLLITVLHQTENICFRDDTGRKRTVRTRVVEEREWVDGELEEVSRNFFARCKQTNAIYYFGEDVEPPAGSWRAGENGAMPGLIMPGTFLLGSRYFQEQAPGVAMDRGENVEMGLTVKTEAGKFKRCVKVLDTTPLEPDAEDEKVYCPRVGLVDDAGIQLVDYGYWIMWPPPDDE